MSYNVQLPNGVTIAIDDDVPPEQARQMIVRRFPDMFKRQQGFMPAARAGFDQAAGAIQTFGADVAGKVGLDSVATGLRSMADKNKQEVAKEYDPTTGEDVDAAFKQGVTSGIGALARKYVTEPAGGMVGSLGPGAMGAAVGAVSPVPGGALTGFSMPFFAQSAGENQERQRAVNPGVEPDMLASTATALAQTALGTFGFGKMINGALGSQLALREAQKLAPKVLSGEVTKDVAVRQIGSNLRNIIAETTASAGINIGTGIADEALRRAQAGQELGDQGALDSYKDIAISGGVLAPVFGVAHGAGARGHAVRRLDDAQRKGVLQREQIRREQQEGVAESLEAERLAAEVEPTVAQTPEQAKALIQEQNADAARRAVEQRDQPGVLAVDKVGDKFIPRLEDTDGMARRDDARAAFEGAEIHNDLLGEQALPPQPDAPLQDRRAPEPDRAVGSEQGQLDLRQPWELTEPPADAGAVPRAPNRATDPILTKRDDFADLVYPTSPTYKNGKLDGHDLNTPEGVDNLYRVLKTYARNVEAIGSDKNAARLEALHAKLDELDQLKQQMAAQTELPLKGGKDAPASAVDTFINRSPDVEVADARPTTAADAGSDRTDLGQRSEQQAVPAQLPVADGRRDGVPDGDAGRAVQGKGAVERPLTPLQERAQFGRNIGAVVDAGGNYLKSRQNAKLGKAMEAGDFEGVVSALANSKNVMIRHVAEQAAKLNDVKVKLDEDAAEMHDVDKSIRNASQQAGAAYHKAVLEGLGPFEDRLRAGEVPDGYDKLPAPWLRSLPELADASEAKLTTGQLLWDIPRKPEALLAELEQSKAWAEKNGGMPAIDRAVQNKVQTTGAKGTYDPKAKEVAVQPYYAKDEHTVAHELVHAQVAYALDNPTPDQRPYVQKLNSLYTFVRDKMKGERDYGLSSVHEFVSEAMTNADFQQKLSKIKYQNSTAWGKFTEFVAKLLGLKPDNAFTEFLALQEGLEGTGLQAKAYDAPAKNLGAYIDSSSAELPKGKFGSAVNNAIDTVQGKGAKGAASGLLDSIRQGMLDVHHGITRFLERAWTRDTGRGTEATARALLQASTYAPQLAKESLSFGFVKKNSEGFWKLERSDNNLRAFLDTVRELPTDEDKFRVANGILTNLAYHEREQMLANNKAGAKLLEAEARKEMKEAAKLSGRSAAVAYRKAKAKLDMAQDLLDTEYQRPTSVTDSTIAQALADAKTPEVKKMLDVVREINRQNIDMLTEGGIITKETADLWKQKQHYVPLQRIMDEDDTPSGPLAQGGAKTRDLKTFKGSERDVDDITANLIKQRMYVVDAALRNNAYRKAMDELLVEPGNPAGVRDLGSKNVPNVRNKVMLKVDGEKRYFSIDDTLALESFQGLMLDAPGWADALEDVTKFFREAIMLSPDAIWRNLVRDSMEVWDFGASSRSLGGVVGSIWSQFGKSLPNVVKEGFGSKRHQPHYNVQSFGITGAKEFTSLDAERMNIVREQLAKHGIRDWGATADGIITGMMKMIRPLQNLAAEGELAPREHVFNDVLKRTGSETEAAMAAINTLDFRRRGAWRSITTAKKLIPFFNSQLQGWYKIALALSGDNLSSGIKGRKAAQRMLATKLTKMAAVAWLYQTMMQDDEDYMEIPKEIRDTNVLIAAGVDEGTGKTLFMKLPLPFEFGTMAWTIPANLNAYLSDKQDSAEFAKAMKDAAFRAAPGLMPQAFKPLVENVTNYNFFAQRELENDAVKQLAPGQRAYNSTSEVAKTAGEATDISPIKLDNFLRGYFGSLGVIAVQLTDKMLADGNAPDKPWHRAPVLKSVIVDPLSSSSRDKFYALKEKVATIHATANEILKKDGADAARAYLAKETSGTPNKVLYDMHKGMQQLDYRMRRAAAAEKEIRASGDSPAMKQARLEQIRTTTNHALVQAMPGLEDFMEEGEDDEGNE